MYQSKINTRWIVPLVLLSLICGAIGVDSELVSAATYSASMSTSGTVNVGVSPAGNGGAVGIDTLTVNSTCPYGYTVSIAGGTDNALYQNGDSSSEYVIRPTTGTKEAPAMITGSGMLNTWGYSLTSENASGTFIGLTNTSVELKTVDTASAAEGDEIPVYYGVSVADNNVPGTYKMAEGGEITYYLTTNVNCMSYVIEYNSNGGTGEMTEQRIYEDVATELTANSFTAPAAEQTFSGWNTEADGSGTAYANQATVTDIAAVGETLTLYAQWKEAYTISYDGNGASGTATMSVTHENVGLGDEVTLVTPNYDNSGYGFAGWSADADASDNLATAVIYGPNETVTINQALIDTANSNREITLHAVWIAAEEDDNDTVTLQDWNGCNALTIGEIIALTDERDNNTYAVTKLADGNCWMMENLRLNDNAELTIANTNNPVHGNNNVVSITNATGTVSNHLSATGESWCVDDSATCVDQSELQTSNTMAATSDMAAVDGNAYAYGNYYNWYSATAGNGKYELASGVVAGDICPTGWHLPTGGMDGEFANLSVALGGLSSEMDGSTTPTGGVGSKALRKYPNNFVYAGMVEGANVVGLAQNGYYWSATADSMSDARILYVDDTTVQPGDGAGAKNSGSAVRCVINS